VQSDNSSPRDDDKRDGQSVERNKVEKVETQFFSSFTKAKENLQLLDSNSELNSDCKLPSSCEIFG
jgi:hypothetical protein